MLQWFHLFGFSFKVEKNQTQTFEHQKTVSTALAFEAAPSRSPLLHLHVDQKLHLLWRWSSAAFHSVLRAKFFVSFKCWSYLTAVVVHCIGTE